MPELSPHQDQLLADELARVAAERARQAQQELQAGTARDLLVRQIQEARSEMEAQSNKVLGLSQELKRQLRGAADAGPHKLFVTGHVRMAGAVQMVVKRTGAMDRLIAVAARQQEEDAILEARKDQMAGQTEFKRKLQHMQVDPISALADLFDEDLD